MQKEYISNWFEEGLKEIGITKKEFLKKSQKEKNKIRKYLEECGHY